MFNYKKWAFKVYSKEIHRSLTVYYGNRGELIFMNTPLSFYVETSTLYGNVSE